MLDLDNLFNSHKPLILNSLPWDKYFSGFFGIGGVLGGSLFLSPILGENTSSMTGFERSSFCLVVKFFATFSCKFDRRNE